MNFGKSKIVLVSKNASYIELNNPDANSQKCLFCAKTSAHEHDIAGKVKFDPKNKSYLVSLLEKCLSKSKANSASKLEIFPVRQEKSVDPPQSGPIFPIIVPDEAAGAKYFAKELVTSKKVLSAVKVDSTNNIHLLSGQPKSVLKAHKSCEKCDASNFDSLSDVQNHFQSVHNYEIKIKDITVSNVARNDNASSSEDKEENLFRCGHCEATFTSDESRIKHCNEAHVLSKDAQLQCHVCLQFFKHQSSFRKHQANEHLKGRLEFCT